MEALFNNERNDRGGDKREGSKSRFQSYRTLPVRSEKDENRLRTTTFPSTRSFLRPCAHDPHLQSLPGWAYTSSWKGKLIKVLDQFPYPQSIIMQWDARVSSGGERLDKGEVLKRVAVHATARHYFFFFFFFFFFEKRFIHVVSYVPLSIKNKCKVAGDSQDQPYRTRCSQSEGPGGEMPLCTPHKGQCGTQGACLLGPGVPCPPTP